MRECKYLSRKIFNFHFRCMWLIWCGAHWISSRKITMCPGRILSNAVSKSADTFWQTIITFTVFANGFASCTLMKWREKKIGNKSHFATNIYRLYNNCSFRGWSEKHPSKHWFGTFYCPAVIAPGHTLHRCDTQSGVIFRQINFNLTHKSQNSHKFLNESNRAATKSTITYVDAILIYKLPNIIN